MSLAEWGRKRIKDKIKQTVHEDSAAKHRVNRHWVTKKCRWSILIVAVSDQAALSGVLETLYEAHRTLLSVAMLKEQKQHPTHSERRSQCGLFV